MYGSRFRRRESPETGQEVIQEEGQEQMQGKEETDLELGKSSSKVNCNYITTGSKMPPVL